MTIHRKIYFLIIVVLFLVSAPLVTLYTAGYRYQWKKQRLERVGFLEVSTIPEKAQVFLDGERVATAPYVNNSMLPGEYEVSVEKSGYHSWRKKISVRSGLSTLLRNTVLWKSGEPELLAELPAEASFGKAGNWVSWVETDSQKQNTWVGIPGELNKNLICSFRVGTPIEMAWNETGTAVIFWQKTDDTVEACAGGPSLAPITFHQLFPKLRAVHWAPFAASHVLIESSEGGFTFELERLVRTRVNSTSDPFTIRGSRLYTLSGNRLAARNINETASAIERTVPSDKSKFLDVDERYLVLLDPERQRLSFYDPKTLEPLQMASATWFAPEPKSKPARYLAANDFELSIIQIEKPSIQLITRFSKPIGPAIWHPFAGHVLVFVGGELKALTIGADQDQSLTLATFESVGDLWIDQEAEALMVLGTRAGTTGLWKLGLKD